MTRNPISPSTLILVKLEFHEFLIEHQGNPEVLDINYQKVDPAPGVIEAIENSDMVINRTIKSHNINWANNISRKC